MYFYIKIKFSTQVKQVRILISLEIKRNWIRHIKIAWKRWKFETDVLNFFLQKDQQILK
jgi:hypothetical protein